MAIHLGARSGTPRSSAVDAPGDLTPRASMESGREREGGGGERDFMPQASMEAGVHAYSSFPPCPALIPRIQEFEEAV